VKYARHRYDRTEKWRHAIDAAVADRVMSGDDGALGARLDAFAPVGEDLRGFLVALVERATDGNSTARLHHVWPRVLERLLPASRGLVSRDDDGEREPYPTGVEELDRALLLVPPMDSQWPVEDTRRLGLQWLCAYWSTPHVVDRAICFVGSVFGLYTGLAIQIVLKVLSDDIRMIRGASSYACVVAWLKVVLSRPVEGEAAGRARARLDRLAATGEGDALAVQQQLEL
jgi:hypothetical protein